MPLSRRPIIGVIFGNLNPYTDLIWKGITEKARTEGVSVFAFGGRKLSENLQEKTTTNIIYQLANQHNVDGVIIVLSEVGQLVAHQDLVSFCRGYFPLPVVSIGESIEKVPSILIENQVGFKKLIDHLLDEHGYRRIAFIKGPSHSLEAQIRYQAFAQALSQHNTPLDSNLILPGGFNYEHGKAAIMSLLQRQADIEAVIACNDEVAWGVLHTLYAQGIHVPNQIAVIGFDDFLGSQYSIPPLSTVRQPRQELGEQALELILAQMKGKKVPQEIILPTEMVIRQSCGCRTPVIQNVTTFHLKGTAIFDDANLAVTKENAWKTFSQSIDDFIPLAQPWIKENILLLFDAFFDEISGEKTGQFLNEFDNLVRYSIAKSDRIEAWHDIISILRMQFLQSLDCSDPAAHRVEILCHQARIQLSDSVQQAQAYRRLQANLQTELLLEVNEDVITTFDFPRLIETLVKALEQIGVSDCFICLNENPGPQKSPEVKLPAWSRLLMAYTAGKLSSIKPGEIRFPTEQLLPDGFLSPDCQYNLYILPLRFHEHFLGHAIFEMKLREGFIYDALETQISNAIRGASLIQELSRAREELECRVEERTFELQQEIIEREKAEAQIRKLNQELERRVKERTSELEAANQELEAFAYSVAHNLRSPLRAIDGYSQVLLEDYGDRVDQEGKEFLYRSRRASQNMADLIDDLLALSKVAREIMQYKLVNLSALAKEQIAQLQSVDPERTLELEIEPDITVYGDEELLSKVLLNLLDNAWKFTQSKAVAKIKFRQKKSNGKTIYYVRDNGCGFDMAYADKLFDPFQRLHSSEEFSGNGIGLATVERIIRRHGGHIWAEAEVDHGTTFYFTLGEVVP